MSKPSLLRRFFGGLWNVITRVRQALANLLFLLVLVMLYFTFAGSAPEPLPEQAALLLNPAGVIVDQPAPVDPLVALTGSQSPSDREVRLRDVIAAIDYASEDPAINSLVMELDYLLYVGMTGSQEIVHALERFRATGKPIVATGDYYTQDQYLLASHADEIIMHPLGGVALEGFSSYRNYYREMLGKLSVNVHIFRAGEHKSAMEPFERDDMSAAEKEETLRWLQPIWQQYVSTVEAQRELEAGAVNAYIDGMAQRLASAGGDQALDALQAGLVDQLLPRGTANDYLADMVGARNEDGLYEAVAFDRYLARKRPLELTGMHGPRVAVITAQGTMLPGDQPPGTIGGDSLAWMIRQTAEEEGVGAIVLRVSSPGGSMFASEIIREQVLYARQLGVPVVISMGSIAASGGYYIAAEADEIWANPGTITGSIGVFAAFPTFEELLQRGGIHTDGVGTTRLAGALRLDRPLNPELKAALDAGVGQAYGQFLQIVSDGRDLPMDEVRTIAEGRVWSAEEALENGLVDALGSLDDAIEAAAARADLEDYSVDYVEPALTPAELLVQQLTEHMGRLGWVPASSTVAAVTSLVRPFTDAAAEIAALQDPRHIYLRCLACGGAP